MAMKTLASEIKGIEDDLLTNVIPVMAPMGMSPIFGRIMFTLMFSPEPVTMQELSARTGYSLSSLSTNLKLLVGLKKVRHETRPGSKKLYFSVMTLELGKALLILMTQIPVMSRTLRDAVRTALADFEGLQKSSKASPEERADLEYRIKTLRKLENEYTQVIEIYEDIFNFLEEKHGIPLENSFEALKR
ncbi:MAG: hypothetical protein QF415_02800 [Candidatus Undinarchaeales archaeon]|jgi:DNA-binding transcriptional regulator GbsR (MarR family)|nr:hypothetical protein [Candidatus Undinarchaeales archaeon]MDP7492753.1 hypothetical protein [Candidatus Undinarchaeales archaeon]